MLMWTRQGGVGPTMLWCDNKCMVRNSGEGAERNKTKHMDIKYMFIHDMVKGGNVEVKYIRTKDMVADVLTKGLGWILFEKHIERMGLMRGSVSIHASSAHRGGKGNDHGHQIGDM